MDEPTKKRAVVLAVILISAFALRMATFKYERFLVFDPAHHYAIIRQVVEVGEFPSPFLLSLHPLGGVIHEPMGLYYLAVFAYRLLAPLGFSLFTVFRLVSPVFGALTLIPLYLLARYAWDQKTAFYSILLLAFLPGHAYRTFSGFYRGDPFSVFFMASGFYLFLRSLEFDGKKRVGYSILAGISLGAMGLVWNGFPFGFVVLSAFSILYSMSLSLRGRGSRLPLNYILAAGIGMGIIRYSMLLQPHVEQFLGDLAYVFTFVVVALSLLEALKLPLKEVTLERRAALLATLSMVSVISAVGLRPQLFQRFLSGYGLVQASTAFTMTIGELTPMTREVYLDKFGIAGVVFALGLVFLFKELLREQPPGKILVLTWALGCLYVMRLAVRFSFLASLPIALISGAALSRFEVYGSSRYGKKARVVAPLVLVLVAYQGLQFAGTMSPQMTVYWQDALEFLGDQEEGGVFAWWDYGSWIQGAAGFPTILDTVAGQNVGRMKEVGGILYETDAGRVNDFFDGYDISYVVISTDMMGQMHNVNSILGRPQMDYVIRKGGGIATLGDAEGTVYGGRIFVFDTVDTKVAITQDDGNYYTVRNIAYRDEEGSLNFRTFTESDLPFLEGTIYVSREDLFIPTIAYEDFVVYVDPELEKTLLTSAMLLDGKGFPNLEIIYKNPQVRVYGVKRGG